MSKRVGESSVIVKFVTVKLKVFVCIVWCFYSFTLRHVPLVDCVLKLYSVKVFSLAANEAHKQITFCWFVIQYCYTDIARVISIKRAGDSILRVAWKQEIRVTKVVG